MEQTFEPLPEIPMDKSFTLDQLTGRFQSVRVGAPELPKNAKDQYARLGILDKDQRQIIVLASPDNQRLGVLDFGGATEAEFDGWKTWSSREAGKAHLGPDIEAGYGNGGKAFMVRGSIRDAYMCSYSQGKLTKMGFRNDDPSILYRPGWYRNGQNELIRSLPGGDVETELNRELEPFGLTVKDLPTPAQQVLKARSAFTMVHVDGVKEWVNSKSRDALVRQLPFDLLKHPQMALTIETCSVWVMRGKMPLYNGPLKIEPLDPFPGFEEPIRIDVPPTLKDPRTKEKVSTGPDERLLEVRTSRKNLRLGDNRPLNVIRVRNEKNIVANWAVSELVPAATSAFLYGTLRIPALTGEHLAGAERQTLADTPLVRALSAWVEGQLEKIATEIQKAQMTRDKEEDRDVTNDALKRMRDLMRQFLNPQGPATNGSRDYGSIIHEIVLEPGKTEIVMPVGAVVPLVYKCYERDQDRRLPILKPKVHMVADPLGIVSFNGYSSVKAEKPGTCVVRLENLEGTVRSNEITIRAIQVQQAQVKGPDNPVKQGETLQLDIRARDAAGSDVEGAVWEVAVDELDLARVGRTGVFTAGRTEGTVTVQLRFGPGAEHVASTKVVIGPEKVERPPPKRGDIPHLLLCGTPAPGKEDLPETQRTHSPGPEFPTIIDFDPYWENVVWINLQSSEATKVRGAKGGPGGAAGIVTQTVYQFLALKCFEVLKRLKVRQIYEEDVRATTLEFLQAMSEAEMDTAGFLDAAYGLVDKLFKQKELGGM